MMMLSLLPSLLLLWLRPAHAQQRPFVDAKKFDYSRNFRTNVCDRQRQLFDGEIELRNALSGLNLTVAMTNYPFANEDKFFTLVDGKIKETDPGLFVVIMDELADRAGFSWRNTFAAIDPINDSDGGKTWTDMLVWEIQNFDIAADYWGRSGERMALGVSFPTGWYDGSIVLAASIPQDGDDFNLWGYFTPFAASVWFAIVGAIFFTGLLYFLLDRLDHTADEMELQEKPMVAVFIAALAFTGHYQFRPRTHAARLLGFSWTFWALIMTSAYTANLASFLVSRSDIEFSVTTLDDALVTSTPVCLQRGAVMDDIISKKHPELTVVRKDTEQEIFQALRKEWYGGGGGCGVGLTNLGTYEVYQGQKATNADCTMTSEKRVILTLPSGFATAVDSGTFCTSLVSHVMDLYFTEMKADGFIDRAWQAHLDNISQVDCSEPAPETGDPDMYSLGLKEMGGIFITHLILTGVAVVVALGQYKYAKVTKPKEELRPVFQNMRSSLRDFGKSRRSTVRFSEKDGGSDFGGNASDSSIGRGDAQFSSATDVKGLRTTVNDITEIPEQCSENTHMQQERIQSESLPSAHDERKTREGTMGLL